MSKAPRSFVPYCATYHCAGDCGLPHNQDERVQQFTAAGRAQERKRLTLAAFDALEHADKRTQLDAAAEVRRKARNAL